MTIRTEEITYQVNDENFTGYLAFDDAITKPKPGAIIVHEWWGHNDYVRGRAEQMASDGFVAFALDMYGSGKQASNPEEAGALMTRTQNTEGAIEQRFDAAYKVLASSPHVDGSNINAAGYCFGGAVCLAMARAGKKLNAVASFHGLLETESPMQAGVFSGEIAVFNGADDPMVSEQILDAFENEMNDAGVTCSVTSYPGVIHSFTNPAATERGEKYNIPLRYDKAADLDSYQAMVALFSGKEN